MLLIQIIGIISYQIFIRHLLLLHKSRTQNYFKHTCTCDELKIKHVMNLKGPLGMRHFQCYQF